MVILTMAMRTMAILTESSRYATKPWQRVSETGPKRSRGVKSPVVRVR